MKNSADIRMVMDVRDLLTHDTYFDEFVILSADADFTPVLHRLRSHARRTVIYSNDHTAAPYTAICDAEIREADFLNLLLDAQLPDRSATPERIENSGSQQQSLPSAASIENVRREILTDVVNAVRSADQPLPLEALADRCVRALGHDKTVGSAWGGTGSFRDLLTRGLPNDIRLSSQPPYFVYDATRTIQPEAPRIEARQEPMRAEPVRTEPARAEAGMPPLQRALAPLLGLQPTQRAAAAPSGPPAQAQRGPQAPAQPEALSGQPGQVRPQPAASRTAQGAAAIQQSIARIHEASQAPTLSPQDYRTLFDVMAQEIAANGLAGAQTLVNIAKRAEAVGMDVRRDDVRFVLDVVSEADPWFDQGASANLFASRFRNFVVARCRGQGLSLSADELDLIEAWFAAPIAQQRAAAPAASPASGYTPSRAPMAGLPDANLPPAANGSESGLRADRWWSLDESRQSEPAQAAGSDEFPRIIRTRLRV
jgi:hypothetical protein